MEHQGERKQEMWDTLKKEENTQLFIYLIYLPKTDFQDFRLCNELGQDFIKMAQ